jgi:hypothetical protein
LTSIEQPSPHAAAGIRKIVYYQEEILVENGTMPPVPALRATAAAVITNPWKGTAPDTDLGPEAMRIAPHIAKALTAIVGTGGEIEHAGALIHTPFFGNLVREYLDGSSIICFADDRAEAGQPLVVPMWHKTHAATRSHYQTITARVPDGPRPDEIVVIAAASTGPRPHARIGDRKTDPAVTSRTLEGATA